VALHSAFSDEGIIADYVEEYFAMDVRVKVGGCPLGKKFIFNPCILTPNIYHSPMYNVMLPYY
jgi:hypothetical protein